MKHRLFIGLILSQLLVLACLMIWGASALKTRHREVREKRSLVTALMLTDFSLWTGAPYLRHPSQADLFSPFQDFPSSLEHFPAGSIIPPPIRVMEKSDG
jgi:uncharacterized membrane protein YsdA (DUF1294 family)